MLNEASVSVGSGDTSSMEAASTFGTVTTDQWLATSTLPVVGTTLTQDGTDNLF